MQHFFDNLIGDCKLTVGRNVFLYMTKEERAVLNVLLYMDPNSELKKGEGGLRSSGVTGDLT